MYSLIALHSGCMQATISLNYDFCKISAIKSMHLSYTTLYELGSGTTKPF